MARIPPIALEDMTPEQRQNYETSPGGKGSLALVLAHSQAMGPGFNLATKGMMTGITIPPLERQICVLATLHLDRGAYEWAQHMEVSRAMGIPPEKVEAIADDRFGDKVFSHREKVLLAFTRQAVKTVRVDDFVFNELAAFYTPRQIVELIQVISLYMMFVRVSEIGEVPIDAIIGGDFWKEANRKAGIVKD